MIFLLQMRWVDAGLSTHPVMPDHTSPRPVMTRSISLMPMKGTIRPADAVDQQVAAQRAGGRALQS